MSQEASLCPCTSPGHHPCSCFREHPLPAQPRCPPPHPLPMSPACSAFQLLILMQGEIFPPPRAWWDSCAQRGGGACSVLATSQGSKHGPTTAGLVQKFSSAFPHRRVAGRCPVPFAFPQTVFVPSAAIFPDLCLIILKEKEISL